MLFTSSLNPDWNNLPLLPAYVPLVRGVVGYLGSFVMPPRNLAPGERLILTVTGTNQPVHAAGPTGQPLPLTADAWEGRQAVVSEPLLEPGLYTLRRGDQTIRYAVAATAEASDLAVVSREAVRACFGEVTYQRLRSPEQVRRALGAAGRRSIELWPWCIAGCLGVLFLETWLTRREGRAPVTPERAAPSAPTLRPTSAA